MTPTQYTPSTHKACRDMHNLTLVLYTLSLVLAYVKGGAFEAGCVCVGFTMAYIIIRITDGK